MENKQSKYFCTQKCYTKFRIGLDVDYTQISCKYPSLPPSNKNIKSSSQQQQSDLH
jgi:hypothetical protein